MADDSLTVSAVHPVTGKSHSVVVNGGNIHNSTINVHFNGRRKTSAPTNTSDDDDEKSTGDHSILIDASAPAGSSGGGVRNSTINLTIIGRRSTEILSSFALSIRSLFDAPDRATVETREVAEADERERLRRKLAFINPAASRRARRAEILAREAAAFEGATIFADADAALPTARFVKRQISRRSTPHKRITRDAEDFERSFVDQV